MIYFPFKIIKYEEKEHTHKICYLFYIEFIQKHNLLQTIFILYEFTFEFSFAICVKKKKINKNQNILLYTNKKIKKYKHFLKRKST